MDLIKKTRDDYDLIAPYFSDTRRTLWRELEQCKQYVANGQRVLDWGCGNGRLLNLFDEYQDLAYVGVDQSRELLKIARHNHLSAVTSGRASFYSTATRNKKFPAEYFDTIFMIASFHHLPDETSRLKQLQKMKFELKQNGYVFITVWNLESAWAKLKTKDDWTKMNEQDFLVPWKNPEGKVLCNRYYHAFKQEELRLLVEQAGFKIVQMGYSNDGWTDDKEGRNLVCVAQKI